MANEILTNNYLPKGTSQYFSRVNPIPLDGSSLFSTKQDADAYAASNPIAYAGQIVAVVESDSVKLYKISNNALEEIGARNAVVSDYAGLMGAATTDNIGGIVYLTTNIVATEGENAHGAYDAGAYIVTSANTLQKLAQSSATGDYGTDITDLQTNKQDKLSDGAIIKFEKVGGEGADKDNLVAKFADNAMSLSFGTGDDANKLSLTDANGNVLDTVDMSKFTKDAVLKSATLVKESQAGVENEPALPYIEFQFNLEGDDAIEPIRLSVSDLFNSFDGSSINLSDSYADVASYTASNVKKGASVDTVAAELKQGVAEAKSAADDAQTDADSALEKIGEKTSSISVDEYTDLSEDERDGYLPCYLTDYDEDHDIIDHYEKPATGIEKSVEDLQDAVAELADDTHTHSNKSELDKIADGDKANWDAAYAAMHTHDNSDELDKIAAGDVAKWNAKQDALTEEQLTAIAMVGVAPKDAQGTEGEEGYVPAVEATGLVAAVIDLTTRKQDALTEEQIAAIDAVGEANSAEPGEPSNATGLIGAVEANTKAIEALQSSIVGVWHFVGAIATMPSLSADDIQANKTQNDINIAAIEAAYTTASKTAANGDVYRVGRFEYAYNGSEWVLLGYDDDSAFTAAEVESIFDDVIR